MLIYLSKLLFIVKEKQPVFNSREVTILYLLYLLIYMYIVHTL